MADNTYYDYNTIKEATCKPHNFSFTERDFDLNLFKDGVYGIFLNNECVYIGSTQTTFYQRGTEHWNLIKDPSKVESQSMKPMYEWLHQKLEEGRTLQFKPLLSFDEEHQCNIRYTEKRDYEIAEWALIQTYKPMLNKQGHTQVFWIEDPKSKKGGLK